MTRAHFASSADGPERRQLVSDERGAILVVGVFMAIFLTAMLAYVAGVGQATWQREQLQDAADGTALSAAIVMARGMNFMVFINLIMEVLVMIILILQILVTLLAAVALILAALWMFPAAALVAKMGYKVHEISDEAKDVIFEILPVLHTVNSIVRVVTPFVAEADSLATSLGDYKNVARVGFMVPSRFTLPMESGTYDRLCERAGGDLIGFLLSPLPKVVRKTGEGIGRKIARQLSAWFCGDGGSSGGGPPQVDQDYTHDFPETESSRACENSNRKLINDGSCEGYQKELAERTPDANGLCSGAPIEADCWDAASRSRQTCNPHNTEGLSDYMYTEATINKTFVYNEATGQWQEDPALRTVTESQLFGARPQMAVNADSLNDDALSEEMDTHEKLGNPCQKYWRASNLDRGPRYEPWNVNMVDGPDPGTSEERERLVEPVCSAEMEPLPTLMRGSTPKPVVRSVRAVTNIFTCSQPRSEKVTVMDWNSSDASGGGEGGQGSQGSTQEDNKAPYLVEADKYLGDDAFQLRAVILGHEPDAVASAFRAARWGRAERAEEPVLATLDVFTTLSLAQAEFFFNANEGSGIRDEWAWNMAWSARLVHFTLPKAQSERQPTSGESSAGNGTGPQAGAGRQAAGSVTPASLNALGGEIASSALGPIGGVVPTVPNGIPNAGGSLNLGGKAVGAGNIPGLGANGNATGALNVSANTDGSFSVSATGNAAGALSPNGLPLPNQAQGYVNQAQGYANQAQGYANQAQGYANQAQGYVNQAQGYANQAQGYVDQAQGYANQAQGYMDQAQGYANQGMPSIENAQAYAEGWQDKFNLQDAAQSMIFDQLDKSLASHCEKLVGADCATLFGQIDSIGALVGH